MTTTLAPDLYAALGLSRDATRAQIRAAYRRLAKALHPDAGGDESQFRTILLAANVLSDADRRKTYDETGSIDENSIENERAAMLEVLAQVAMAALPQFNTDYLGACRALIGQKISEGEQQIAQLQQQITSIDAVLKKLKRKTGDGALLQLLAGQRKHIVAVQNNNKAILARWKAASDHLKDYEYEFSTPKYTFVDNRANAASNYSTGTSNSFLNDFLFNASQSKRSK